VADKTAELLMGASNPNLPDEDVVRREVIEQLRREVVELQEENAELRCASRLLNDRLLKQAMEIDRVKNERDGLDQLVRRARLIVKTSHLHDHKTHRKYFNPLTMATPACITCRVLVSMERSVS